MKASFTGMLALLAGAYAVHAQGTVFLGNYLVLPTYIYVSFKPSAGAAVPLGGSLQGTPAPTLTDYAQETQFGADWTVALYGAAGGNASQSAMMELQTAIGSGVFATSTFAVPGGARSDTLPGTWNTDVMGAIPGATGHAEISVQLAAWYNDGGTITSLTQAIADGVPTGESTIANTMLGDGELGLDVDTVLPSTLGNFVVTVPEGSTTALVVVGASTFLLSSGPRRKTCKGVKL